MVQGTPTDKNTGWNLNDNKPVDLPDQVPAGQPSATPQSGQAAPAR